MIAEMDSPQGGQRSAPKLRLIIGGIQRIENLMGLIAAHADPYGEKNDMVEFYMSRLRPAGRLHLIGGREYNAAARGVLPDLAVSESHETLVSSTNEKPT